MLTSTKTELTKQGGGQVSMRSAQTARLNSRELTKLDVLAASFAERSKSLGHDVGILIKTRTGQSCQRRKPSEESEKNSNLRVPGKSCRQRHPLVDSEIGRTIS